MLHQTFLLFFLLIGIILPFGQQQQTSTSSGGGIRLRSLLLSRNGQLQLEQQVQASATKRRQFGSSRTTLTTLRPASTAALPTLVTTASQRAFTGRPGCQVDIVLLMDMSGGALDKRERYLGMAAELIRSLDVDEFGAQVALVRYSGKGRTDTVFRLKNRHNQTRLLDEIANVQPLSGTTRTREAMLHTKREFEQKFGGREKADRVLIVFTDGYSQDDPSDIAPELRRERIHVFAVAVEDEQLGPNVEQLKTIASDPQSIVIGAVQFGILKNKVAQPRCRQ